MNKFSLFFRNIATSGISGDFDSEAVRKTIIINLFSFIGVFFLTFYGIIDLIAGDIILSIVLFFISALVLSIFVYLRITKNYIFCGHSIVIFMFVLFLYLFISGATNNTGFVWYYVFPVLALFTVGRKYGTIYNFLLFTISMIMFIYEPDFMNIYDKELKSRMISSFLIVFILSYIFEYVREKTYKTFLLADQKKSYYLAQVLQQKEEIKTQADQLIEKNQELEKLSIVASKTNNAIVIMDPKGNYEWANEGFTNLFGYTLNEYININAANILEGSTNPHINEAVNQCMREKKPIIYTSQTITKSRKKIWVQTTLSPIIDKNGDITNLIAIDSDFTEIKLAELEMSIQKQEITDSISYASKIQKAIQPPEDFLNKLFPQHFILNIPKDIVSGDFYWIAEHNDKTIVAVADCTGHGVPGALMSMIGISFLNKIVKDLGINDPSEILNHLREQIILSLHQTGKEGESQDGMDISIISFDKKKKLMQYAGAMNSIFFLRNKDISEIKADRMPIGIFQGIKKPFINHEISIKNNDTIYLFTDGFIDQFGGNEGKKFKSANFKKLIVNIHEKNISEQKQLLQNTLTDWQGNIEQIDDILIIGIRF
ncbi:MAG: SpoIIE family protein phosphatase [Bacteroidales bacterium]|nr:SpoIIE family protein phosphatase [Bacteroidales bacterium]